MDAGTTRVDYVEVVGGEVGGFDTESAGEIVTAGFIGTFALRDGYGVFRVILVVGGGAIDGKFASKDRDSDLFVVCSWLDEDDRSGG